MIPWCARCGAPVEHAQLSRYELGGVVLVRAWCHGEVSSARVKIEDVAPGERATMFPVEAAVKGAES